MDMGGGGRGSAVRAEINVTPLVDVCLVILIIFMVVAPYLVEGRPVQLPKAQQPQIQPDAKNALTLSMDAGGDLYLGQDREPLSAASAEERLRMAYAEDAARPIRFQADRRLTFADIKDVLKALQSSGFKEMALMVQRAEQAAPEVSNDGAKKGGSR